ncbi:MAG: hypothetical protein KIS92_02135 [Planctomycetota bacterium]|nr:hypothetical protein [Planctomycetota bacterium]
MKLAPFAHLAVLCCAAAGPGARAEEAPRQVLPALAPDPAVLKQLEALGENQSAWLPPVKTAGPINDTLKAFKMDVKGPQPRDYCRKWVWAADRKRALFCGENAGAPHRLNDVWEYDLASNTWVLLHEPDADFLKLSAQGKAEVALVKDGILTTRTGAPYDPVHAWWQIAYDPNMHALLWAIGNYNKCGFPHKQEIPWGKLEMFAYFPFEKRWEYIRPTEKSPPGHNASILEYIPDRAQSLWFTNTWRGHAASLFDPKDRSWTHLLGGKEIKDNAQCPGPEAVAAYDAGRKILVAQHGGLTRDGKPQTQTTYTFDLAAREWKAVLTSTDGPEGLDMRASMTYDAASNRCFLVDGAGLWSYAVGEKAWTKHAPEGPAPPNGMLCHNPAHNVLMIKAGENAVWVWRSGKVPAPAQ